MQLNQRKYCLEYHQEKICNNRLIQCLATDTPSALALYYKNEDGYILSDLWIYTRPTFF